VSEGRSSGPPFTGSPVSLDYFDEAPFAFNGTIEKTQIKYMQPK